MNRVVIVGGGISGMTLAYRLGQTCPDADVRILERGPRLGGTIHTEEADGFRVEWGPNGFLDSNPTTLELCRELGLGEKLIAASESAGKNRFLYLRGAMRKLPSSLWSFLRSDVVGCRSKLLLLTERFRRGKRPDEDESIYDFACRRAGREVAETLADAFVTGIFAGDAKQLSLRSAFPRLDAFEREHGSILRGMAARRRQRRAEQAPGEPAPSGPRMWSFPEGLQILVSVLAERLSGVEVGVSVSRIAKSEDGWAVHAEDERTWPADVVVLTCPVHAQAKMVVDLDGDLAERMAEIPYNRICVVALGYREDDVPMSLDGFGYLTPGGDKRDVLGVQWCSSIFPERAPSGMVLLRAMCGGWHRPELVEWDDDRLLTSVRAELERTMGILREPTFVRIVRWPRAIPQYHIGHGERVRWIRERVAERHPGLHVGGNGYSGVALNDCVEQAGVLARCAGKC